MSDAMREAFEKQFALPPYEWSFTRYKDTESWPGNYRNYSCECAWDAWQAATIQSQQEIASLRQQVAERDALIKEKDAALG